ncbi:PHP domain-containing protein [bacterium]|nr:PHP domain-containing protein [bacterium]
MAENYIIKGAIHIHSTLSDGTGDIDLITRAAKKSGLDFIIVTDHNYYDIDEGIINGVYVIKGEEISPSDCNHYLAFGTKEKIDFCDNPQTYIDEVRAQGGFGFAAHPDEGICDNGEKRKNSYHCIPWTDKSIKPDGVEIWNWFSSWADSLNDRNIFTLAYSYLFKHNLVGNPKNRTLKWWDDLNNESEKIVPALGGVDAHALKIKKYIIPVTIFPYETCFKTITNIIHLKEELSKDFQMAKNQILNAIKNGNNTIVNRYISKELPQIYIKDSQNTRSFGEETELSKDLCIHFESKRFMEVRLVYNGKEVEKIETNNIKIPVTKSGKYRIEVLYKGKGFLYTNPFYVKEKAE